MSEDSEEDSEASEKTADNVYSYPFIRDERMLRCFVFEVATTHCEVLFSSTDLDEIYQWINVGKLPPKLVTVK